MKTGASALEQDDIQPLLDAIEGATSAQVRLTGLDALTRFELADNAWRAVGPALRQSLVDATPGSPERETAMEVAFRAPLASVRADLVEISEAADDPDAAKARRLLSRPSPLDVEQLLQMMEADNDRGAAETLAGLPIESMGYSRRQRHGLSTRLRRLTRSAPPDVGFWAVLCLARLGDLRPLRRLLGGTSLDASIFWGSPWAAYDALARLRPVPDRLQAFLQRWMAAHPEPERNRGLVAWALTGSRDAEGRPIEPDAGEAANGNRPERSLEEPPVGAEEKGPPRAPPVAGEPEDATGRRAGDEPTRALVDDVLVDLLDEGGSSGRSRAWDELGSVTSDQASAILVNAFWGVADEVNVGRIDTASVRAPTLGNRLVDLAARLPSPIDLPVGEMYRVHRGVLRRAISDRQTAWVLSRSAPSSLVRGFAADLPAMASGERLDALRMLGWAGSFQRGAAAPFEGAGPGESGAGFVISGLIGDPAGAPPAGVVSDPDTEGPAESPRAPGSPRPPAAADENATSTVWPYLDAPAAVVAGRPFALDVGLGESQDRTLDGTGAMVVPARDFSLGVELLIDGFAVVGDRTFTIEVTAEDRYPKRMVTLIGLAQADLSERRRIGVVFRIGREMRGYAGREILVKATESDLDAVESSAPGTACGVDTSPFTAPGAADLTVVIQHGNPRQGLRLVWSVASPHADIPVPADPSGPTIVSSAEEFLDELVAEASSTSDALDLFASLRGRGRANIAPLMPDFVKEALRQVAEAVRPRHPTVLLVSQDPYVPWELAVLDPPLPDWPEDGSPFLGAQAAIGRWMLTEKPPPAPEPPKHLTVREHAVVTGVYEGVPDWRRLESAEKEADELKRRWPNAHPVEADLRAVLKCINGDPEADIIHFALHGQFSTETARQGLVLIGRVPGHPDQRRPVFLKPSHVDGGRLTRSPLVFLNACQVGAGRLVLGNYSGLAGAFVRVGAAAVVAPLWSVNDAAASDLALDFYDRVLAGEEPPAEVLRANRASVTETVVNAPDGGGSGTWLAYQFFGHPNLRITAATSREG